MIDAAALENLHVKFYMFKTHMRLANLALFELSGEGYTNIIRVTAIHMSKFYIRFVNIGPNSLNVYALMEFRAVLMTIIREFAGKLKRFIMYKYTRMAGHRILPSVTLPDPEIRTSS